MQRTVLISGAGVAGSTLAYWLARHGFHPTVVERAQGLRSSGNPVDVRGPAVLVAEAMGVMPRLRAAATEVTGLSFVNARGRRVGHVNMGALRTASGSREVELPRADLASILFEAGREHAEVLFDDSIASLHQQAGGVDVTFERATPRRFDLVIGADGLHSVTRRLAFGADADYISHTGLYVATTPFDGPVDDRHDILMHNDPGRAVSIHPARGKPIAAFIFRLPAVPGFDYRDTEQHKRIVIDAYAGGSWRIPELLDRVRAADDLYFDSVSQVRLPKWSTGRLALLGDAASCVSLFGEGSSLAMAGAATLAEALAASPDDPQAAFRRYETRHRLLVEPKQGAIGMASALMVPASRTGIVARNLATRTWPVMAAAQWAARQVRRSPVDQ
jgi:2-polyprenyl-6-methoxyphenol hydroxylase-like FAD-dependent oxidoreductase